MLAPNVRQHYNVSDTIAGECANMILFRVVICAQHLMVEYSIDALAQRIKCAEVHNPTTRVQMFAGTSERHLKL